MNDPSRSLLDLLSEGNHDTEDEAPSIFEHSPYLDNEGLNNVFNANSDSFKVFSLNCQSLNSKFDELKIYIESCCFNNYHAICLQETWLSDSADVSLLQLNGYNLIWKGKSASQHGGVAIYLKDSLKFKLLSLSSQSNVWDGLFVEVQLNHLNCSSVKKSLVIGNIYRPPRDTLEEYTNFISELDKILHDFQHTNMEVVLVGDFNIDLLKLKERTIINDYFEVLLSNSFIPKITFPTRITNSSSTLIDNIFVKLSENFSSTTAGILLVNISDHLPCFVSLDYLQLKSNVCKYVKTWSTSEKAFLNFKNEIAVKCTPDLFNTCQTSDPNENYEKLEQTLRAAHEKHIPVKFVKYNKHKHKLTKWITNGILSSIKFRDKLYRRMLNTQNNPNLKQILKTNLSSYNKILKSLIRDAKKSYFESCFKKFRDDIKKTWSTIKLILNKKKNTNFPDFFIIDGVRVTDKNIIANGFNKYFTDVGPKLSACIESPDDCSFKDYLRSPVDHTFTFKNIGESDVLKIIDSLKSKSSSGIDGISNKLMKLIKNEILFPLTLVINQSLNTGIFPNKLKIAKVVPLLKKKEDYLFENYRPISVLPSLSKVLERVMHKQVVEHFIKLNLFYKNQYGFRHNHSTELSALEVTNTILMSMDKKEVPLAVFMDLSKAFDTIDHSILLDKLYYYGIRNNAYKLFESYLNNRKQFISIENTNSSFLPVKTGVPQGSILGPLLFIIYINDLHLATEAFHPIVYADDTTLSASLNSFNKPGICSDDQINMELEKVSRWLKLNKLSLNSDKTKAMLFHFPRKSVIRPVIKIDGSNIEFVNEFNYLGIILDQTLSWKSHIAKISLKVSKVVGIMCRMKNLLSQEILLTLYNSLCLPYFIYGILCWKSKINNLVKLQKRAIRVVVNAKYNAHTEPIFKRLNSLKLSDLAELQEMKFVYKLVNNMLPSYFSTGIFQRNSTLRSRNTRSSNLNLFHIPRVRCEFARNSIQYQIPIAFNNCPQVFRNKMYTHSQQGFSLFVKKHFINSYNPNCVVRNCFLCNS